jgi:hypothetical protein
MRIRTVIAFAALATLASAVPAHADVVWLLKEQAGVRATVEWTDPNGIRQKATDARTATLADGSFQLLQAEVAILPASADDRSSASYGVAYWRYGTTIEASANGAVVDEWDSQKIRIQHREEVGYRIDFKVDGPSVRIRLRQFSVGQNGSASYVLYNRTKDQIVSTVTNHQTDGDFGIYALNDGDVYVLVGHIQSKGSQGVEYALSASFDASEVPVQLIPVK